MSRTDRPIRHKHPCKIPGCEKWAWAQGYCDPHYQKLKREGVIQKRRIMKDDLARFHTKYAVNEDTGCWEWVGPIHPHGYGMFKTTVSGKQMSYQAHRFAYEKFVGPIPEGVLVLHRCDNRKCVNPADLFTGDEQVNSLDCLAKGRHASQLGTNLPKLTWAIATNLRVMYAKGLLMQHKDRAWINPYSINGLARIFDVNERTASSIVRGRSHLAGW